MGNPKAEVLGALRLHAKLKVESLKLGPMVCSLDPRTFNSKFPRPGTNHNFSWLFGLQITETNEIYSGNFQSAAGGTLDVLVIEMVGFQDYPKP